MITAWPALVLGGMGGGIAEKIPVRNVLGASGKRERGKERKVPARDDGLGVLISGAQARPPTVCSCVSVCVCVMGTGPFSKLETA